MDFYNFALRVGKKGLVFVFPDFVVQDTKDLMIRGGKFYAVWDEAAGLWSTSEARLAQMVDTDLRNFMNEMQQDPEVTYVPLYMRSSDSKTWEKFLKYCKGMWDTYIPLDNRIAFDNEVLVREDYVSFKLRYPMLEGDSPAWDQLLGTLYHPQERAKIEWAIGSVIHGDSKILQKFFVFYGAPGTGKSTILNIIQMLFEGYWRTFDAKALGQSSSSFATEAFLANPLVAIQHDGDLSRISDNSLLNSIVSHDTIGINAKYMAQFQMRINSMLFMGTNQPVNITDAKSGVLRRLIDIHPTGVLLPGEVYESLMAKIPMELGAIAHHCLRTYEEMGPRYYANYTPMEMMSHTNDFYNFMEDMYFEWKSADQVTLATAWDTYQRWADNAGVRKPMTRREMKAELRNYFEFFHVEKMIDGERYRSLFMGFKFNPRELKVEYIGDEPYKIVLEDFDPIYHDSHLNVLLAAQPAQEANQHGNPPRKWENAQTTLGEVDPKKLHWVKVPRNHIVIDFDLTDENGAKSLSRNMAAAQEWPATYTEVSAGGNGLHLHYIYDGDVDQLASVFTEGIEIKTLLGDSSLRRRLTRCNNHAISTLTGQLPKKEVKAMLDDKQVKSEKGLRALIERNLRKEVHPGTKPSIDFIHKILTEAYESGLPYDVTDMKKDITTFAMLSTHQADYCMRVVQAMPFASETDHTVHEETDEVNGHLTFFDVEVYPNLLLICWKSSATPAYEVNPGDYPVRDDRVVAMINPSPEEVERLTRQRLVGFNNRRYDNHILYARMLGHSIEEIYHLSQSMIVEGDRNAMFGKAYDLSYADIYDFLSEKQGLKKWQIQLGLPHVEMDIPWDEPVPDDKLEDVILYCQNDVLSEQAVFEARRADFEAREILAELSGLTVNATTQAHTAAIVFEGKRDTKNDLVYTDLSEQFPGYTYHGKESEYRGEDPGRGGYVYAEPGIYADVVVLDVASMHPTSIVELGLFGRYTRNFEALMEARLAIKRGDLDAVRNGVLGDRIGRILADLENDDARTEALAYALKIVINSVYGLTSAHFDNPFKDNRNKDNIVAKRGALFMIDLKHFLQEKGVQVIHIKTDSIKLESPSDELVAEIEQFGKEYGYTFEVEDRYDRFALVNDAVYIAHDESGWHATGAQFAHPYVFKILFSHEEVNFDDYCETKQVLQGTIYLGDDGVEDVEQMQFVGRVDKFVPVTEGGRHVWRIKEDRMYAVTGTKDHMWIRAGVARRLYEEGTLKLDMTYYDKLTRAAIKAISQFGDFNSFTNLEGEPNGF